MVQNVAPSVKEARLSVWFQSVWSHRSCRRNLQWVWLKGTLALVCLLRYDFCTHCKSVIEVSKNMMFSVYCVFQKVSHVCLWSAAIATCYSAIDMAQAAADVSQVFDVEQSGVAAPSTSLSNLLPPKVHSLDLTIQAILIWRAVTLSHVN